VYKMNYLDTEIALTLARLLDYHYPWKTNELFSPDFCEVNDYLIKMSEAFQVKFDQKNWADDDLLDKLNDHLLDYCKQNPFSWKLAA
jgi:hypothetical protein